MSEQDKATTAEERFTMPRKAFIAPSKPLVEPTLKRDNTPAVSVAKLNLPILNLPTFGNKPAKEKVTLRAEKSEKKEKPTKQEYYYAPPVLWGPEHVCSDEEFIIKTRAHSIHDPGIKELFYANGGDEIVDRYETIAMAFDSLRRYKAAKIGGLFKDVTADSPLWQRITRFAAHDVKVFVPGGTHADAQVIREQAVERKHTEEMVNAKVAENQEWLNEPLRKVG